MNKGKLELIKILSLVLIILVHCSLLYLAESEARAPDIVDPDNTNIFATIAKEINETEIINHLKFLTSLKSRVTGYPEFYRAAQYIVSKFKEYNVKPYGLDEEYCEYYNITVPIDLGASIRLSNEEIYPAYCLWPMHVNPSPYKSPEEGDTLIYVGKGELSDYNGKNVSGKWVLMDFNSKWHFRIAMSLGVRGIIYVGNGEETRIEALQKLYDLPLSFPRLYVTENVGEKLLSFIKEIGEIKVWIKSSMEWRNVCVANIVGWVQGTASTKKDEAIVLAAYYDSWSIVPSLSPGATDALGIAVLLETARIISKNPPQRSVIFLALSGHWQCLWGAREYVDRHFNSLGYKIRLFASLNLATGSDNLAIYNIGETYSYMNTGSLNSRYSWLIDTLFKRYLPAMREIYGEDFGANFMDRIFYSHPPGIHQSPPTDFVGTFSFDSEPYVLACYGGGFAYHTTNDVRVYQRTPADTFERLNLKNLWPQAYFVILSIWGLANEPEIMLPQTPRRFGPTDWGFSTLIIQVSEYNPKTAFWDPFDAEKHPDLWRNVIVNYRTIPAAISQTMAGQLFAMSGRGAALGTTGLMDIVILPNSKGEAIIKGVKPFAQGQGFVDAFVIDGSGRILWSTDLGVYAAPPAGKQVVVTSDPYRRLISIFPCGSIALFSLFDPNSLLATTTVVVNYAVNHGPMIHQSVLSSAFSDTLVFIEPDVPVEILVYSTTTTAGGQSSVGRPIAMLTNVTGANKSLQNYGYVVKYGETLFLRMTPYEIARNIYHVNDQRFQTASRFSAINLGVVVYHEKARKYLNLAEEALKNNKFDLAYASSFASWSYERNSYAFMMDLIIQVVAISAIFFITLVPGSLILQKIISPYSRGIKRFIEVVAIFIIFLIFLGIFHPGFHIASNIFMSILSICIISIVAPLALIVLGEVKKTITETQERLLGKHKMAISRTGAALYSISLCLENMRKRPLRSSLTLISMLLLVFSLISFTSLSSIPIQRPHVWDIYPTYNGILIRKYPWTSIPEELYLQFRLQYGDLAEVVPRTWFFPPPPTGLGGVGRWYLTPKRLSQVNGILFLTPEESDVASIDKTIIEGRWLTPEDTYVCLISKNMAQNLTREIGREIKAGSTISFLGLNLTVIGIYDGSLLWDGKVGIIDLDGEPLTPIVPTAVTGGATLAKPPHLQGDNIIIMPYSLALILRGNNWPVSIAIKPKNPELIYDIAVDLALRLDTNILYALPDAINVKVLTYRQWFSTLGLAELIIPLAICGLIMLNLMLGNVYERAREIKIYMSVGLSPLHVTVLFLMETIAYVILSSIIGYILGIAVSYFFVNAKLYPPEFYPNYASTFVLLALLIAQSLALLSSLYPSYKASTMITPSLERKWKLPSPEGDVWEIVLPFTATKEEIFGVMNFIKEYLSLYQADRSGAFMTRSLAEEVLQEEAEKLPLLKAEILLAPFDLGITQLFVLEPYKLGSSRYGLRIRLSKLYGVRSAWISGNRAFIDGIRKQLLLWRSLSTKERSRYIRHILEVDET
ncbi:MAG: FtsX-like permease family protein [Candidatus Bathyarchaeia archaeon]